MSTDVILVDENDQEVGLMEKNLAHELGLLHRAFSIFIFNDKNELLLQQRAATKVISLLITTYNLSIMYSITKCIASAFN